jgi:hypothetical protein
MPLCLLYIILLPVTQYLYAVTLQYCLPHMPLCFVHFTLQFSFYAGICPVLFLIGLFVSPISPAQMIYPVFHSCTLWFNQSLCSYQNPRCLPVQITGQSYLHGVFTIIPQCPRHFTSTIACKPQARATNFTQPISPHFS